MFNTAWTDLVLKVGGQILLAVLIVLAVTFGADPFVPKKNIESMMTSRAEQSASATAHTNAAEQKTNSAEQKTNSAKKNEAEQKTNAVEQKTNSAKKNEAKKNAVAQKINTSSQTNEPKSK